MSGDSDDSAVVATASEAMDHVLRAEREALAAVAECERQSVAALEQARQQRRAILERAQARAVALHARGAQALKGRTAAVFAQQQRSAAAEVALLADPAHARAALERLAARLTTAAE